MIVRRLLPAVLLLAAAAAAPAWADQWYEHYEQGLELADRGAWQEALESFQAAGRFRPEPAERARTYGNRFLFGYDPHFQQARCLVELGRPEEARSALARSAAAGVSPSGELAALEERIGAPEAGAPVGGGEGSGAPGAGESTVERRPGPDRAPDRTPARLAVVSSPPGVPVMLDGRPAGRTPLTGEEVAPGRHRVRVDGGDAYRAWEQEIDVAPGERVQVNVALSPRPRQPQGNGAPQEGGGEGGAASPVPGASGAAAPPERRAPEPAAETVEARSREAERGTAAEPARATPAPTDGSDSPGVTPPARPAAAEDRTERPPRAGGASSRRPPLGALLGGTSFLLLAVAGLLALRRRHRRSAAAVDAGGSGRIGDRVGPYRIEGVLGRGGMATTYRARRRRDDLAVALKIPHETGDPTYLERFLREGRLGETLHHPGIVRILEAGEEGGRPYLAMELLPGRTLRQALDEAEEPPPVQRALAIAVEIAEALDYAHGKGVVHRDLKPENVMVLPDGRLQVMDFGVARVEGQPGLTTSSFFFGSPVYAAPELVDPRSIDHRADLYSLGVLLYELLEGEPPFVHESVFRLLEMHQSAALPEPESLPRPLPPEVWRIVSRLLAKDPAERHRSAQELLVELKRYLHRETAAGGAGAAGRAG